MAGSLESNKIAAAILVGGLLTLGVGIFSDILYPTRHMVHEEGGSEDANASVGATAGATQEFAPSLPMIAQADPAQGQKVATKCLTCHSFDKGGSNKIGPNLWNIVGNKPAHIEGFAYSEALKSLQHMWTFEELDKFIANPKAYAKGTKMTFVGLKKPEDRAALLSYLRTLSDSPQPAP